MRLVKPAGPGFPARAQSTRVLTTTSKATMIETVFRTGGSTSVRSAGLVATEVRAKIAVLIPSTNTVVESEFSEMAPDDITVHAGRMLVQNPDISSDEATANLLSQVRAGLPQAVASVTSVFPDIVVMGMSAPTFFGGLEGHKALVDDLSSLAGGLPVVGGSGSVVKALHALKAKSIGILTPYQAHNDEVVRGFFEEAGFEVSTIASVRSKSATGIAETPVDEVIAALRGISTIPSDVIVQVGTNLPMIALAQEAMRWLGTRVLPINLATMWDALRTLDIADDISFGSLLEGH